jgi:NADH:ubiquinone oxidoreductase subunit C
MKTNGMSPGPYQVAQEAVGKRLTDKYLAGRKIDHDVLQEQTIWAKDAADAKFLVRAFMFDENTKVDFLSDLTAYDNCDGEDGEGRFVLVYQLFSTALHIRIRVKCLLTEHGQAETITDLFLGANWLEREVFDMYGITFSGHPNLRRIMMDERFTGYPLRKEYPIKQREPFQDNIRFHMGANPREVDTHLKEGGK